MRMLFAASTHGDLLQIVRSVRKRWRLRVAVRGLAIVLSAAVAAFLIATYGMDHFRFTPVAVTVFRVITYVGIAALFVRFLVLPLSRRLSDEQVALYLEEHEPSLKGYVLTGVQFGAAADDAESANVSPALIRKLVRQAIERCMLIEEGRRVERRNLIRSSGWLAGATLTGLVFLLLNPPFLRHGIPFLFSPWSDVDARSPYAISVSPGNTAIARGSDLRISAQLQNFNSDEVDLAIRSGETGEWERWPMTTDEDTGDHVILLFDLNERSEYYVEASGVRSELYRIEVSDLPYVDAITLEYHYPAYTGLSPLRQEGSGDIAALRGTRVDVTVVPTVGVPGGMLVVDETDTVGLAATPEGALTGTLRIRAEGMYHVVFDAPVAGLVNGSPDYVIDVLSDLPPSVAFVKPGRDVTVTSVEEVFTEVRAEDDYGVAALELLYSVNGGPEQRIQLYDGQSPRREVSASHTFYLEEANLEPGDLVSYYARATEPNRGGAQQTATTDIYFMEVRPFDREYRQAEQQGGGGGGQGGSMEGDLSGRQRDIIAGTFRMVRDRDQYSDEEYRENLATLALAQGKLREEVETLVGRIRSRGIVELDSAFQAVAEALPQAIDAMDEAEEQLGVREPQAALPPEQRALQHLQRAEAAFNETQVSRGGGGGGGGGQAASAEDLADLFDLEMDKLRNQYEQVQRGRQEQTDAELDETLQKLKELARRQQQQIDRMRAQQNAGGQAGGGAQAQRRLADEAEELARQLERLSREQSRPDLQETARSLRDAAEAMRRAAANARNNGVGQGVEALDQLREARRLLDQNRSARTQRDAEDALNRVERLAEQQRQVADDVDRLSSDPQTRSDQVRRLQERKTDMAEEVAGIEAQLDQAARAAQSEQREAAQKLREAAKSIRDNKLREALLWSRGVIQERSPEYARNLEEQIGSAIDELRDLVRDAAGSVGETREQRLGRSLDRTRSAVNALESLRDRLEDQQQGEQQGQQGERQGQQGQQQGQQGQQQGQQGEQQGQQGQQQGQQGQQQGQGGQQQGQPGGDARGQFAPDARGGGGPGRIRPLDPRQFGRELRERQTELQELREQLRREGVDVSDLDAVIGGLRDLDRRRALGTPQGLEQLEAQIIQGLKEFEFNLRRALEFDTEERLTLSGSDDVPSGYRELVEEYYRSLSRSRRPR